MAQDFSYAAPCGCCVVFTARSDFAESFLRPCGPHSTRSQNGLWRDAIAYQANEAFVAWDLAGRPATGEVISA